MDMSQIRRRMNEAGTMSPNGWKECRTLQILVDRISFRENHLWEGDNLSPRQSFATKDASEVEKPRVRDSRVTYPFLW